MQRAPLLVRVAIILFRATVLVALVLVSAQLLSPYGSVPGPEVSAHTDRTPAPNGRSPWDASESWSVTCGYECGYHVDMGNGEHLNDSLALDFNMPAGRRVRPIWDGMTVAGIIPQCGGIYMEKVIGGQRYRLVYGHLDSILVSRGQTVGTNTVIGYSGNKATPPRCVSNRPHLHVSLYRLHGNEWHSVPPQFCGRTWRPGDQAPWQGC
jgi:hypothetical protein